MLALATKPGKSVFIGQDIRVTVLRVEYGRATIRFKTQKFIFTERGMLPSPPKNGTRVAVCHAGACYRIGGNITVAIGRVTAGRVIVAVEADPSIRVDREEVHIRRQHEQPRRT
jgi:sRNA-binding carbon storage regulator CsrA